MSKILIVEDEESIAELEKDYLELSGFEVEIENDGEAGLKRAMSEEFDLFILDLMLPGVDGFEICKKIRETKNTPIIMISAKKDDIDKIRGLGLGADDYITKPFGTSELLARIRTALRHVQLMEGEQAQRQTGVFHTGDLEVDYDKRRVYVNGEDAHLTQNEYKIVALLSKYSGRVLTYDSIIKHIWGPNAKQGNQILRVNMANIRRKIEPSTAEPRYIMTEMGVGYRMAEGED